MAIEKILRKSIILIFVIVILSCLSGCFLFRNADIGRNTPEALYQEGVDYYQNGKYKKAIESFERLKEVYPLSPLAILAEIGVADAHFSDDEFTEAENAYTEFADLHPTHENLPYVYYQLGLCHYKNMFGIDRDQTETLNAKKEFEKLIARFPGSKFAFMAEKKLKECEARLAEYEFYVGHFYFKMKKYKAALKRFETVAKNYPNLGLDYKVDFFISETKRCITEEEAKEKLKQVILKK